MGQRRLPGPNSSLLSYYDSPDYYSDSGVEVAPAPAGVDASYCAQRFRSYDPATGTYLGYDRQPHPCP